MKIKMRHLLSIIVPIVISGCTLPHQDTVKLHSSYLETPAIDKTLLQLKSEIYFKPGATRFIYPPGIYKPEKKTADYVYYLSPQGVFVDPIGKNFYCTGGIKVYKNGTLKFLWGGSTVPVGKQDINDYTKQMELLKNN